MAVYRKIVEVTDTEAVAEAIRGTGFNFTLLETKQDGNSIVEFWCSDDPLLKPSEQHNLGDLISALNKINAFVRILPSHDNSPVELVKIINKSGAVVDTA